MSQATRRRPLTVDQALVAYTRGSAFAEFQEKSKGSLEPGMLADVAVVSKDIFKVPADTLSRTVSVPTILGGRIVLERSGSSASVLLLPERYHRIDA